MGLRQRCERNERHNNTNETKRKAFKKPNVERIKRRLKRAKTLLFRTKSKKIHLFLL